MRVLQIFNRYLQFGGEEGSVYRIVVNDMADWENGGAGELDFQTGEIKPMTDLTEIDNVWIAC